MDLKFENILTEWFWFMVFHEVAVTTLARDSIEDLTGAIRSASKMSHLHFCYLDA